MNWLVITDIHSAHLITSPSFKESNRGSCAGAPVWPSKISAPSLLKMKMEIAVLCCKEVRINERPVLPSTSLQTIVMTPNDSPPLIPAGVRSWLSNYPSHYWRTSPFVSVIGRHVLSPSLWILPISQPSSLDGLRGESLDGKGGRKFNL